MNNEKIDISKLYSDKNTKKNNSLIFLNDYLKTLNKEIDINTDIMTFAKKFEYEKKFEDTYIQKKIIAPFWEIALESWIEDLQNISYYNLAPFVYYNDISRGENKPLHNYINFIVKPIYEEKSYNDFLSESEIIGYEIIDEIVNSIVEGVICAKYLKKLTNELNELHKKEEIIIEVAKDITPLNKEIEPIVWTGDNVLLGYLIQWLKDEGFIKKKSARDTLIKNHFVDENGKPIENIKQGLSNTKKYNEGSLPKDFEKIQPLLKTLKDLL
jgi:hypothetical protein